MGSGARSRTCPERPQPIGAARAPRLSPGAMRRDAMTASPYCCPPLSATGVRSAQTSKWNRVSGTNERRGDKHGPAAEDVGSGQGDAPHRWMLECSIASSLVRSESWHLFAVPTIHRMTRELLMRWIAFEVSDRLPRRRTLCITLAWPCETSVLLYDWHEREPAVSLCGPMDPESRVPPTTVCRTTHLAHG